MNSAFTRLHVGAPCGRLRQQPTGFTSAAPKPASHVDFKTNNKRTDTALAALDVPMDTPVMGEELIFTPLHPKFGARVEGVDLRRPLAPEAAALLNDKMCEFDLLLFPGQTLTPEQELRAYQYFPHDAEAIAHGSLVNKLGPKLPDVPAIAVRGHNMTLKDHHGLTSDKKLTYSEQFRDTLVWHMDCVGLTETPNEISGMYMLEAPEGGGETLFASMQDLYEQTVAADPAAEEELNRLVGEYQRASFLFSKTAEDGITRLGVDEAVEKASDNPELMAAVGADVPTPFVVVDPATNTRNFLVSPNTFYSFSGMSPMQSREKLERMFCPYVAEDSNVFWLSWAKGDLAMWRNRRMLHSSTPWKLYPDETRLFHLMFLDSNTPLVRPGAA